MEEPTPYYDEPEFYRWIDSHISDDPSRLRLKWAGKGESWIPAAILQIECRRKYARKLPRELQWDRFVFGTALSGEQSSSDILADLHAQIAGIKDNAMNAADLTAGLGVDAFAMAAIRPDVHLTLIERDENVYHALRHNAEHFCGGRCVCINADCHDILESQHADTLWDVVFIDPARRSDAGTRVHALCDCSPDVTLLMPILQRRAKKVIIKLSPMLDVSHTLHELPQCTDLWITGTVSECKELIAVVDPQSSPIDNPQIHIWTPEGSITYTQQEETAAKADYSGHPQKGDTLYEPWAVTMKGAPFKLLSENSGLKAISANSHLYYGRGGVNGFPGQSWVIEDVLPYASRIIKRLSKTYPRINVAVRNFPVSADQLRAKLGVKDGDGNQRLIATTLSDGSEVMIVLHR